MLVGQNISVFQASEVQTFRGSKLNNWWCIWMRTFILFVKVSQIFFKMTEVSDHISPLPYPEWTCELVRRCLGSGHFNSFGSILILSLEEFLLILFMLFIKLLFCYFRPFLCVECINGKTILFGEIYISVILSNGYFLWEHPTQRSRVQTLLSFMVFGLFARYKWI